MSIPLDAQSPLSMYSVSVEETRGAPRLWGRVETREQTNAFGVACRDVIDEARLRMASRGYRWD